ncbi:TonB-dependent siderophore receptor [Roseicella frigidaeris]|uniref:TonB-dependent siderophore receptor n=1 Tax=Roseicella frigidaeris TaxID=2230885 RepID=A0A327MKN2_9PROT|nr:TonB-dependent siderophore receptor [Roseicella frigidaeris]RAI60718.1 TonB-dependent siderophore receptor [Roseicella frigidaeris]
MRLIHARARLVLPAIAVLATGLPAKAQDAAAPNASPGAAPSLTLPTLEVQERSETATGPVRGFVARQNLSGTKTDTPLLETPQSVSVITRDQMDARAVQDTQQALRYAPGVFAEPYGSDIRYGWSTVRGYSLQGAQFLDGMRLPFGTYAIPQVEPWGLERLELLRGPASVLYGQIPPGGMLNMISRRPTDVPTHEVQLQTGSFGRLQGAFDLGGPIDKEGKFLYRFTGLARDSDSQSDEVRDRRLFLAPSLTWRISPDTSLTLLSYWQRDDSGVQQFLPVQGTLRSNPYGSIPINRFVGEKNANNFDRDQWGVGYAFSHRIDDRFTLRQNLRYSRIDFDMTVLRGLGLQTDLRTLNRTTVAIRDHVDAFTMDNQGEARLRTGPVDHTILAGLDFRHSSTDYGFGRVAAPSLDIFNPVYGRAFTLPTSYNVTRTFASQDQVGLYVQDQARLGRWLLTVSGRQDWVDSNTENRLTNRQTPQSDSATTGRVGLNYLFDFGLAPYVSWSQSFQPQIGTDASATPFRPTRGEQWEVGLRYQPPSINASVSLAAYTGTLENVLTTDPANSFFQVQTGEARVRGIEIEGVAGLARGLSALASYTYTDSKVTKTTIAANRDNRLPLTPEHTAALWLDYTFPEGPLAGLGIAGGARYVSGAYGDAANLYETPTATLFDAAIRYDLGRLAPGLAGTRLAVNATNLGDKRLVTCASNTDCFFAARRTILATLSHRW